MTTRSDSGKENGSSADALVDSADGHDGSDDGQAEATTVRKPPIRVDHEVKVGNHHTTEDVEDSLQPSLHEEAGGKEWSRRLRPRLTKFSSRTN